MPYLLRLEKVGSGAINKVTKIIRGYYLKVKCTEWSSWLTEAKLIREEQSHFMYGIFYVVYTEELDNYKKEIDRLNS